MNESKPKNKNGVKRKQKAKDKSREKSKDSAPIKADSKNINKRAASKKVADKAPAKNKKSGKKSKKEETKDQKGPKRAWPAFFFFQKVKREPLKQENPELSQKELVSKLGEMWRGMNDETKKPYLDQERKDKARYNKEKEEFKGTPAAKTKSKGKAKGDKIGPKRAWPPFFFYQQERREDLKNENPDLNHKEIVSKLGEEWRQLTDEKKRPFLSKAETDQKRYEKEKKLFISQQPKVADSAKEEGKGKAKGAQSGSKSGEKKDKKESESKSKPKKAKKRAKSKTVPVVPKKKVVKPKPPPRPAGGRSSKRIKKIEEEQYKSEVQEYTEAKGLGEEEVKKLESLIQVEDTNAAKDTTKPKSAVKSDAKPAADNDGDAQKDEKDIVEKEVSHSVFD
jgi:hypothetical protein